MFPQVGGIVLIDPILQFFEAHHVELVVGLVGQVDEDRDQVRIWQSFFP